jgi:DNA-binding SARP family transcriptional activator
MTLSVRLLGSLVIETGDRGLGKIPKKARALLAFLAAQHGQPVARSRVADMLWPYQGHEQSLHSLRNCLMELRKALGRGTDTHLAADYVRCRIQDAAVDLVQFEQLSRSQRFCDLQAAADLYRGELLDDVEIDSEPFQEWLTAERRRTLAVACDILQRLMTMHDAAGDHDAAIQCGRRLVFLDPFAESGQRALMRAYAGAGRRSEALLQYRSCAETLKRELGVAPDTETQSLAIEIGGSKMAIIERSIPPARRISCPAADALIPLGIELGNAIDGGAKLRRGMAVEIVSHIKSLGDFFASAASRSSCSESSY